MSWKPQITQQVDVFCKLLATIDGRRVGLRYHGMIIVRQYLRSCESPDLAILKQFKLGGFFNIQDVNRQTPLHAIFEALIYTRYVCKADAIKVIIDHGTNPSITNIDGDNALHIALN